jgi:hypothetical protein
MSDSIIIVGIGITNELRKHWAQGYHRDMDASSRDFQTSLETKNPATFPQNAAGPAVDSIIC